MQVGDLVTFPGAPVPATGIILRTQPDGIYRGDHIKRVKVYWIEDAEVSWEPIKWLELVNACR